MTLFQKDGLIFDGKGYFYNYFTNKTMLDPFDTMVGFARIIHDDTSDCDILYHNNIKNFLTKYYLRHVAVILICV